MANFWSQMPNIPSGVGAPTPNGSTITVSVWVTYAMFGWAGLVKIDEEM